MSKEKQIAGSGPFSWHGSFVSENTTDGGEMQPEMLRYLSLGISDGIKGTGYFFTPGNIK
jgi:hypothetical protein